MSQDLQFTDPAQYTNTRTKQYPKRLTADQIKFNLEVSDTDIPAEGSLPLKYLPTVKVIKGKDLEWQPIVIPVGTIVSAVPVGANDVYVGVGYNGDKIKVSKDDINNGYGKTNIALVPANGGNTASYKYTTYDAGVAPYEDAYQRVNPTGTLINAGDTLSVDANIPLGIAFYDIFLDDAGAYLNYTSNNFEKFSSFETDRYIQMVYVSRDVDVGAGSTYWIDSSNANAIDDQANVPTALNSLGIPMMYVDDTTALVPGQYVQPNISGKFSMSAGATVTATKTLQDVGRLVSFASDFPKGLEGNVITLPGAANGGTDTYGLQPALYQTAVTILKAQGATADYAAIKGLVDAGTIGFARINLKI